MLWLILAWAVTLVAAYVLGYHVRGLAKKIEHLEQVIQSKVDKKPEPPEPVSTLIDPADPVQEAIWAREQELKRMNQWVK